MKKTIQKQTQHNKRIEIINLLYQYFLEKQTQIIFNNYFLKEQKKNLVYEQYYKLNKIIKYKKKLINLINQNLKKGWNFNNLKAIEQSILIFSTYEIIYTKIDKKIIINEAIIITKNYCLGTTYKYINAVLDKINK